MNFKKAILQHGSSRFVRRIMMPSVILLIAPNVCHALDENVYRQFLWFDSRKLIWFLAQMHLFFGAFVLGVPLFAVIVEAVGWRRGNKKFDRLAHEFAGLLSMAFAVTAAFGGLLSFALLTLYPTVMMYMAGIFKDAMLFYGVFFFGETFCLYLYYYGWDRLSDTRKYKRHVRRLMKGAGTAIILVGIWFLLGGFGPPLKTDTRIFITLCYFFPLGIGLYIIQDAKSIHIFTGIMLNIAGTAIMQTANSWVGFMMSPGGVSKSGELLDGIWPAFDNALATPLAIHRMLGNLAFGGLIAGAYAAVKFLSAKNAEDRAHYDWMGYIANFVAILAIIPLPFAGYYLGREVYSYSALMGNNMMGGDFSWTFIIQAVLVGSLFLIGNYYLWSGMTRIPGAERYFPYIKFILGVIVISLAVWVTPHNLPLTTKEVSQMGGSHFHPTLKFLGLMPAKNAVVNLIILSTFFSFLLYRRGNRSEIVPISKQGKAPKILLPAAGLIAFMMVGKYALHLLSLNPVTLNLPEEGSQYFNTTAYLLLMNGAITIISVFLALKDRGHLAQGLSFGFTVLSAVVFLGIYGFVVMEKASPFLRNIAVSQFLLIVSCILLVASIDFFLFRGAGKAGDFRWGRMSFKSQYALLFLSFIITLTMGLMGFVRSGLRGEWHIYGVMRDTSGWAYTPDNYSMTTMVSITVFAFFATVAFMFWLGGGDKGKDK